MQRRFNPMNPFDYIDLGLQQQKLGLAAAETIWRRSSLYSRGALTPVETMTMMFEKPTAMAKGMENAAKAAASGKTPVQIVNAALAPMTAKASSNAKRLRR